MQGQNHLEYGHAAVQKEGLEYGSVALQKTESGICVSYITEAWKWSVCKAGPGDKAMQCAANMVFGQIGSAK